MPALPNSLTELEQSIVRETDKPALTGLDEDALLELHQRIRRVRDKYQSQYRRSGAVKVSEVGGRGKSSEQNQRARDKAEVFEGALSRVSTALAKAARESAAALKAERLADARAARALTRPAPPLPKAAEGASVARRRTPRSAPGRIKRDASEAAVTRQKQGKKDAR